jgi:cytochrome c-type protein NapB
MKRIIKTVALGALLVSTSAYAVSVTGCTGCHGQHFEKAAMGKSKIVKDMSLKEVVDALKGYKAGTYGNTMKNLMVQQVQNLTDSDIEAMSLLVKADASTQVDQTASQTTATATVASGHIDLNAGASDKVRIKEENLGNKSTISERDLGLRKTDLYSEDKASGDKTDYSRPAPGNSTKFERAYRDAPPMIPHSVDGLLPITKTNNQCLGCHLPAVASSVGATAISQTHFTNYRPTTVMKDGNVLKEGKIVGTELKNVSDIKIAKAKKSDTLYQGRFNCTQCHAPQSKTKTDVANTFRPDFGNSKQKAESSLLDSMNEGVK